MAAPVKVQSAGSLTASSPHIGRHLVAFHALHAPAGGGLDDDSFAGGAGQYEHGAYVSVR